MPTALTDNLDLNLPEVGASRDSWGTLLNQNFTTLDSVMPIGAVLDFAGPTAPAGFLVCDGSLISRTTYSDLFAAIGTAWGAGDGSTTFKLPSHAGRAAIGPGSVTDAVGHTTGFAFAQLTGQVGNYVAQANLPNISLTTNATGAHTHGGQVTAVGDHNHGGATDTAGDHQHTVHNSSTPGPGLLATGAFTYGGDTVTDVAGAHLHGFTTYSAGGHAHYITSDGNHSHTVSLGGGAQLMSVLSPVIVMTKIIFAGKQAITATALAATTPRRELSAPLRGSH
jgi:microcystin-dependent protein